MSSLPTQARPHRVHVDGWRIFAALFTGIFGLLCLYPFLLVIAGSFTPKEEAIRNGFRLFPGSWTTAAYQALFINGRSIVNGYKVTVFVTVVGTAVSLLVNSMMGWVVSRKVMPGRKFWNFYILFTMLFSGGMVPWYIVCVNILHLKNTIFALLLPSMVSAWNIFLLRNYFSSVPEEMYESARIDGAQDFRIFISIYLPLSKPVLATVTLFTALGYWNDWWLGLMLMDNADMYPLQLLLRNIVSNIQFLQTMESNPQIQQMMASIPGDGVKMALVILTTGPILLLYPFLQRYFVKGIMVGAVKG
ncbi:MAG: carbohydrate ABC transporter permease [Clostridia bacterium]|nr:carbohydrate ABC transporter permease [Clostridia bacterium]